MQTVSQLTDQASEILKQHGDVVLFFGAIFYLSIHLFTRMEWIYLVLGSSLLLAVTALFYVLWRNPEPLPVSEVSGALFVYGVVLFVLLSEAMQRGIASFLTRIRGDKWTKEIDYVYLAMGSVAILASLNRLEVFAGRIERTEIFAPVLLTTAIVIRFIKTRAEIGGWNKPSLDS